MTTFLQKYPDCDSGVYKFELNDAHEPDGGKHNIDAISSLFNFIVLMSSYKTHVYGWKI